MRLSERKKELAREVVALDVEIDQRRAEFATRLAMLDAVEKPLRKKENHLAWLEFKLWVIEQVSAVLPWRS